MFAEVPAWLADAGTGAAALTALAVFAGLISRSKPGRWIGRQASASIVAALSEAFEEAITRVVAPIVHQMARRGDYLANLDHRLSALADTVDELAETVHTHIAERPIIGVLYDDQADDQETPT